MNDVELNRLRTLQAVSTVLVPMIEDMHSIAYERLLANFRNGSTENLADLARCDAYQSILEQIKVDLNRFNNYKEEP